MKWSREINSHCRRRPALGTEFSGGAGPSAHRFRRSSVAFTLIEVMIASGIFFMCMFVILGLVASALRNARRLQRRPVDAGTAAAQLYVQFTTTNQVSEGSGEGDFGDAYPGYRYMWNLREVASNDLCQLDVTVQRDTGGNPQQSKMSMLLYLPNLRNGIMDGPLRR